MPEALIARRPLGMREDQALHSFGHAACVLLTERPLEPAFELQFDADDNATATTLADATGLALTVVNRAVTAGGTTALWLGPGHWLIKPGTESAGTLAPLERAAAMTRSSFVDVSDLWFGVSVEGDHRRNVMAKGCTLDLDPQVFVPGATAVTQFARLRALIHHVDGSLAYHVYVERSYATYLWAWLVDAMTEFLDQEGNADERDR